LHEKIRIHSMAAAKVVKEEGKENDLIERIANDKSFNLDIDDIKAVLKPENFIGRAKEQTEEFLADYVSPVLDKYKDILGEEAVLNV
ncbi:MAG: adenylosuccinate lyase, partial [Clostridia bacterium]|nr:adenylosuccinate lyase [Clostridia bacterium]